MEIFFFLNIINLMSIQTFSPKSGWCLYDILLYAFCFEVLGCGGRGSFPG